MNTQQGPSGPCRWPPWAMLGTCWRPCWGLAGHTHPPTANKGEAYGRNHHRPRQRGGASLLGLPEVAGPAECCRCWCCAPSSVVAQGRRPSADDGKARIIRTHAPCIYRVPPHPTTSRKPSRCPCGFTVDRMSCFPWSGDGVSEPRGFPRAYRGSGAVAPSAGRGGARLSAVPSGACTGPSWACWSGARSKVMRSSISCFFCSSMCPR